METMTSIPLPLSSLSSLSPLSSMPVIVKPRKLSSYRVARKQFISWYESSQCKTIEHKVEGQKTIEHVVPQCLYRDSAAHLSGDMHNFLIYPGRLNSRRSNFKLTDRIPIVNTNVLDTDGSLAKITSYKDFQGSMAFSYMGHFVPLVKHRGRLSRCIAYFALTYPEFAEEVFTKVMDPTVVLLWHHMYPISKWERTLDNHIMKAQGNHNLLVTNPECINLLNKHVNMDMFKDFDYANHYTKKNDKASEGGIKIKKSVDTYFNGEEVAQNDDE